MRQQSQKDLLFDLYPDKRTLCLLLKALARPHKFSPAVKDMDRLLSKKVGNIEEELSIEDQQVLSAEPNKVRF